MFGCNNLELTDQTNGNASSVNVPIHIQTEHVTNQLSIMNQPVTKKGDIKKSSSTKKSAAMLNVVLIKQNPELKYGCEVTSLAMVLNYAGVTTNKMELYKSIKKDSDPLIRSPRGDILRWGNPNHGFVGDMTGNRAGYAVFDQPMIHLINKYLPNRAVNLTGHPFDKVLEHVSEGYPIVVWTTGDFRLPDRWESWNHGQQLIKTPLDLHAVVLVGYDSQYVYLNDPLSGRKQVRVSREQFIASWKALNCRAVSYH
jgi:uncharacterized protein YvpB